MKRRVALYAAIALWATNVRALELPELASHAKPSVVLLTLADASGKKIATGTGFFVSSSGRIVTNHHVIDGGSKVTATLSSGKEVEIVGLLAADEKKDIAILQARGAGYPALTLGVSEGIREGDEIAIIGSPLGLSPVLTNGIVSAVREQGLSENTLEDERERAWSIQVNAAVSPGSSGSPIMNRKGEVIAVAVGQITRGQNLNFGVSIDVAKDLLSRVGPDAVPRPLAKATELNILRNLAISAGILGIPFIAYLAWSRRAARRAPRRDPREFH